MTRRGVLTPSLAFLTLLGYLIGKSDAIDDCATFITDGTLTLDEGVECDLNEDIVADTVIVLGHMRVLSGPGTVRQITCTTFRLEAGGTVDPDGIGGTSGTGAGNSDGSGGQQFHVLAHLSRRLTAEHLVCHNIIGLFFFSFFFSSFSFSLLLFLYFCILFYFICCFFVVVLFVCLFV